MANSAGRPYYFAVLPDEVIRIEDIERFFAICEDLSRREMLGLSRALYKSYWAVIDWKYHRHLPSMDVILRVIEWDKAGRELTTRKVTQSYVNPY